MMGEEEEERRACLCAYYAVDDVTRTHTDLLGDVVDNDDAVSSSVVAGGDGSKPLLTGRVPLRDTNTHSKMVSVSPDSTGTPSLHDTVFSLFVCNPSFLIRTRVGYL